VVADNLAFHDRVLGWQSDVAVGLIGSPLECPPEDPPITFFYTLLLPPPWGRLSVPRYVWQDAVRKHAFPIRLYGAILRLFCIVLSISFIL